jgi:ABC-type transport system involved in multi-copper enzyme maturation permease subunit
MVLALVRKELRETRGFAVIALVLFLVYVSELTGKGGPVLTSLLSYSLFLGGLPPDVPFVQGNFNFMLFLIGGVLAVALGFRQSAWEPSQGTALYLLHLPITRRTIILTKLATGIGLLLACTLLTIVSYAAWAAMPGTHPGPFEWSMTGDALRTWLVLPLFYLGAFASGIRPARWFGSRLLPLTSVSVPASLAYAVPFWWLVGLLLLCVVAAWLVSDILWVSETRDY